MSGAEYFAKDFPTLKDWENVKLAGVRLVRLPIAWENIQTTLSAALNAAFLASLKSAIAAASARDIDVIVDLHNYGAYVASANWGSGSPTYTAPGNTGVAGTGVSFLGDATLTSAAFVDIWTRIATALVGTPGLVGYDIMNEPTTAVGTNLLFAPNGFANTLGSQGWMFTNNPGVTATAGANPTAGYGPAWDLVDNGFSDISQTLTLANVQYTFSIQAKVSSGTNNGAYLGPSGGLQNFTATTSWQTFSKTFTPTAGPVQLLIVPDGNTGTRAIQIANAQLNLGATRGTYDPNSYLPFAQAVITAIRAIDNKTPIYVNGLGLSNAYQWPWLNYELATLTGGNLVFDAHQYFDGTVLGGTSGGQYAGSYASYGINAQAGVNEVTPFVSWLSTVGATGILGEFGVPNNDDNWLALENNVIVYLKQNNVRGIYFFYGNNGSHSAVSTNVVPAIGDTRISQMLARQ